MPSIFTKIISGEIPSFKIMEDDQYYSFLDIRPINPGHSLVIPKSEVDYIFDCDDALLSGMMVFAKKVARKIETVVDCKRIGMMVAGLEVPHAHIHLVPIQGIPDLNFANAKEAPMDELAAIHQKIVELA